MPIVFGWFVLRSGYGGSLRVAVATYAIVGTAVPLAGRLFSP